MAEAIYRTRYAIGLQSSFQTADDCVDTIDGSSKSGLLLNERASFDFGLEIVDQRKTPGSANRRAGDGAEYQQGNETPVLPAPFDVSAKVLYPFLRTFFQTGTKEWDTTSPAEAKWFYPVMGENTTVEWLTIVRDLGDTNSFRMIGGVPDSLEINAETGGNLNISANMLGYDVDPNYTLQNENFEYSNEALLQWQNAHIKLATIEEGSVEVPEEVYINSVSLTVNNGAVQKNYNSKNPRKILLNEYTGEGSLELPWDLDYVTLQDNETLKRFLQGKPVRLIIYWDADSTHSPYPNANGQVSMVFTVRMNESTPGGDDEIINDISFSLVEYPIFRTEDNTISDWTNSDTSEVTVTFNTSNAYPFNQIFPGDMLEVHDATPDNNKLHVVRRVSYNLPYDNKSNIVSGFTAGETVVGGTSGAEAVVIADNNATSVSGTLNILVTDGVFQEDEQITGQSSGYTADINFTTGTTQAILTLTDTAPTDGGSATYATIISNSMNMGIFDSVDRAVE